MNTFGELKNLPTASPVFRAWLWKMERAGLLEKLLQKISRAGLVDREKSLNLLLELSKEVGAKGDATVACCDMKGDGQILQRMKNLLRDSNGDKGKNTFMVLGTISHSIMPQIVSGEAFRRQRKRVFPRTYQLELFGKPGSLQAELFAEMETAPLLSEALFAEPSASVKFSRVSRLWEKISEKAESVDCRWPEWGFNSSKDLEELFTLFSPLFRRYARLFKKFWREGGDTFAVAATMMSLASAMVFFKKEKSESVFLPEVPILDFTKHGLSGGRADAVRMSPVSGKFSKAEKKFLEGARRHHSLYGFKSFGELSSFLESGPQLSIDIVDWKFLVGDVVAHGSRAVDLREFDLPLAANVEQMKRYLSLSSLSSHFHDSKKHPLSWDEGMERATLCYLSPFAPPSLFAVDMDAETKMASFLRQIVEDWDVLQKTAELRNFNNQFCRELLPLLEGPTNHKNGNGKSEHSNGKITSSMLPIFGEEKTEKPIKKIVRRFKEDAERQSFVDEFGIIKRVHSKRYGYINLMDFGKLLDAIAADKILTKGITGRGGFVNCLVHEEKTPSMRLSLDKELFYCFGCGFSGKIINIPKELAEISATMPGSARSSPLRAEMKNIVIPEKHNQVMMAAQEILHARFRGSEAEKYLRLERGIDPDFAFSFGAGYGNDALINGLMDWGLSLDELHFYGFVGFSPSVTPFRGICSLLKKRGISYGQMAREVKAIKISCGEKRVITKDGYPYASLNRRATFPLTLAGKNTSFYGRAAHQCDKRFSHRKLKAERVPQGGFNMEVLDKGNGIDEVFVVESVIDGLSLMMITGNRSAISVIGVDNYIVLDLVAESDKRINLALNNDPPDSKGKLGSGQRATQKITERFGKRGISVGDLTSTMLVPAGLNDYNDLWRRMAREKQKHEL